MKQKIIAIFALFVVASAGVFAWGEGNAPQTHFIHWQPQEEQCTIPGTFLNLSGYLWLNATQNQTVCIPFGNGRYVSKLAGDTIIVDDIQLSDVQQTTQDDTQNDSENSTQNDSQISEITGSLIVKLPYPKQADYVFICNVSGLQEPVSYDWEFDDGSKLYDRSVSDVYHTFTEAGSYHVTCVANDEVHNFAVWSDIIVSEDQIDSVGNTSDNSTGNQTDDGSHTDNGNHNGNQTDNDHGNDGNHTDNGNHNGNQTGNNGNGNSTGNGNQTGNGNHTGNSTGNQTQPQVMLTFDQQGASFHFTCQQSNFSPEKFDWNFGDGHGVSTKKNTVVHTFHDGKDDHVVTCTASVNSTQASDFIAVHNEK